MNKSGQKYQSTDGAGKARETAETFVFDGRPFGIGITAERAIAFMSALEMCLRARHGEKSAAYTLDAFGFFLADSNGKEYWPMKSEQPAAEALQLFDEPDALPFTAVEAAA